MTYRGWLARAVKRFEECGIEEAEADAWLLLAHGAGIDRLYYSLNGGEEISEEKLRVLEELAVKRCAHIPVQRLTGEAWFMGYSFYVNDHVLVPRQDTEVLAEYVLSVLAEKQGKRDPGESGRPLRLLDLCTGSGCILLSILKETTGISGTGTDISPKALAVARENAIRLGVEASFLQSDLWERIEGAYDVIVSNPPYIARKVIRGLAPEVREHEPMLALDGGEDGLDFYRTVAAKWKGALRLGGRLIFEVGMGQSPDVEAILSENGFEDVRSIPDTQGILRVVSGTINE